MKTVIVVVLMLGLCAGCSFITTAAGSLAGNVGADYVKEQGWFDDDKEDEVKEIDVNTKQ